MAGGHYGRGYLIGFLSPVPASGRNLFRRRVGGGRFLPVPQRREDAERAPTRRAHVGVGVSEFAEFHSTVVRGEEIHEPLVIPAGMRKSWSSASVVPTSDGQPTSNELAEVVPGDVAGNEQRMNVVPERIAAPDERLVELVGKLTAAFALREQPASAAVIDDVGRLRPRRGDHGDDDQMICSMTFCSSRTFPGHRYRSSATQRLGGVSDADVEHAQRKCVASGRMSRRRSPERRQRGYG